jgi:EmrB/QacA subfamily drug resistance transporter
MNRNRWALVAVALATFMTYLDNNIVNVAIPDIQRELGLSTAGIEWVVSGYILTFAGLLLAGGRLADRFGRRRLFLVGLAVFTVSSLLAGFAGGATTLIAARALQGIGAAAVTPTTLAIISATFTDPKERNAAVGIWGGVGALALAVGPVLGGLLTQHVSWEWIFWINVPVGLVVAALSTTRLTESRGPRPQLDLPGLALVGAAFLALTWAPVKAPALGWGSPEVYGTLTAGVVLLGVFTVWERIAKHPMLPVAYFRRRAFMSVNFVAFFQFVSVLGSLFIITQLFQIGMGYRPLDSGLRILVWMAMPMLIAPPAGALADRYGNKPFMMVGLALQGIGLGWLGLVVSTTSGYGVMVAPLAVSGVGISLCFPTVANAVVGSVPLADSGLAAGTNSAFRELGGVFGIAVMAAVFAANGSYANRTSFVHGFRPAMLVAALVPALGLVAASLAPSRAALAKAAA